MRYRLLGNSGLRVSEAALGTMTFGDDWGWGSAKDEARKVYDAFREAGGNFIPSWFVGHSSPTFLPSFDSARNPEFEKVGDGCAIRPQSGKIRVAVRGCYCFLYENSVVRADRLWRVGGAVRRHRTDLVRL